MTAEWDSPPFETQTAEQGRFGRSLTSAVSLGASSMRTLSSLRATSQQTGGIRQLAEWPQASIHQLSMSDTHPADCEMQWWAVVSWFNQWLLTSEEGQSCPSLLFSIIYIYICIYFFKDYLFYFYRSLHWQKSFSRAQIVAVNWWFLVLVSIQELDNLANVYMCQYVLFFFM